MVGHRRVAQCILGVPTLVNFLVIDLRVGVRASVARVDEVQFRVHAGALQVAEDLVIRAEQGCCIARRLDVLLVIGPLVAQRFTCLFAVGSLLI